MTVDISKESFWKKKSLFFMGLFLVFFILSFRFVVFRDYENMGHNWDWGFPGLNFLLERINYLSFYAWNDINLGVEYNLQSHLVQNLIVGALSHLMSIKYVILVVLLSVVTVSFISFKFLLDLVGVKSNLNYIPSFLYAFSPFLFNEILGGSWYMWISYAGIPMLFISLINFLNNKSPWYLLSYFLSAIFVLSSLQNFVLIEFIILLYLLFKLFLQKEQRGKLISRYFFAHLSLLFVNLYWILVYGYSLAHSFYAKISDASFTGNFKDVKTSTQDLLSIFSLTGYLNRNMYQHSLGEWMLLFFVLAIVIFWLLTLASLVLKNKKDLKLINWLSILLILLLIIKGGNAPFSSATMFIFNNFTLMALYRSPQHLMLVAAFIIPIIMSLVLYFFVKKYKYKKTIILLFGFIVMMWTGGWWYNGDLGHVIMKNKNKDYVDLYSLDPNLKSIYKKNNASMLNYRIIFLPTSYSPEFLQNNYQNEAQGGQAEYMYLKNSTFSSEFSPWANIIDDSFCQDENLNLIEYLSIFNVRYLVVRYDIYPHHTACGRNKLWDISSVQSSVDQEMRLEKKIDGEYAKLYSLKNDYFFPVIYTPKDSLIFSGWEVDKIPGIISLDNYKVGSAIYFKNQYNNKNDAIDEIRTTDLLDNNQVIEYKKINPTKYRMRIHGASGSFPLVFSENFHEGWKAYATRVKSDPPATPERSDGGRGKLGSYKIFEGNEKDPKVAIGDGASQALVKYKILDGNIDDQASKEEVANFIKKGWVTDFGNSDSIDFISKNFQGTIQNDNLPVGKFYETWLPRTVKSYKVKSDPPATPERSDGGRGRLVSKLFNFVRNDNVVELPEENHLMVNGYANSWIIDPTEVCQVESYKVKSGESFCIKNADGSYDMELIIEFWPQRLFYVGLGISGTTLLGCLAYLGYGWRKRRKNAKL